jgi:hypothetical protein
MSEEAEKIAGLQRDIKRTRAAGVCLRGVGAVFGVKGLLELKNLDIPAAADDLMLGSLALFGGEWSYKLSRDSADKIIEIVDPNFDTGQQGSDTVE